MAKVFIVECNLSSKLKKPHILRYVFIQTFSLFWSEELTLEVCPCILDTPCINAVASSVMLQLYILYDFYNIALKIKLYT